RAVPQPAKTPVRRGTSARLELISWSTLGLLRFGDTRKSTVMAKARGKLPHREKLHKRFLWVMVNQCVALNINSKDQHGQINIGDTAFFQVPHELLKITDTAAHFICQGFDGYDLYSGVDITQIAKNGHLGGHVIDH